MRWKLNGSVTRAGACCSAIGCACLVVTRVRNQADGWTRAADAPKRQAIRWSLPPCEAVSVRRDRRLLPAADRRVRPGGRCPHRCGPCRSEEHTSELQALMRNTYAV